MLERKGLGIRFAAAVIDAVFTMVVSAVLISVVGAMVGGVVALAICLAYPLIEIAKAQSPGKMILKLKIYSEDGSAVTREQLIQRSLIRWSPTIVGAVVTAIGIFAPTLTMLGNLAALALAIALLVMSWQSLQTTKQTYWDVRAKTAVMGPATAGMPLGFEAVNATTSAADTQIAAAPATTPPQV